MDDDPLSEVKLRLQNWGRWSNHDVAPKLSFSISSIWRQWIPSQAFDCGWGDSGPPEWSSRDIFERDAILLDDCIGALGWAHRFILKRHYVDRIGQDRQSLDAACRALLDVMQ